VTAPRMANLTALLRAWSAGDAAAGDTLIPLVYNELRRQAARFLARERGNHTLRPTALVNEVYLRLARQRRVVWQDRAQFFAVAATVMRRLLVDHARRQAASKRGRDVCVVSLDDGEWISLSSARIWTSSRSMQRLVSWRPSTPCDRR